MAKTISKTTILHLSILLAVLIIFISLPNASAAFPSDGLISYFKLDESGNTNISLNSINPSLNGTGVGINSTNHVVGLINNGIYMYNGQYIRIDENAIFDFSDNFSISFWLTGNTTDTGWGQIISKDDCGSERSWNIFYVGGQFCAGLWNPTEQTLCNDTFIPLAGQFYNIVLSYNYINSSSSQAYLYINNELTAKNLTIGGAIKTTTTEIEIGSRCGGAATTTDGIFDEIGIWNTFLNTTQISSLYNGGLGISYGSSILIEKSYPINNYNSSSKTVNIGCNFTSTLQNISSVKLNVYNSSNYLSYTNTISSLTTTSYNATWTTSSINDGNYSWECFGYGSEGVNASSGNRTFIIDTTVPLISSIYPNGNTINFSAQNISINYSVSDSHLQTCWYSLNGGINITLPNCVNNSFNATTLGTQTLTIYTNDTFGNWNSTITTIYLLPTFSICNSIFTQKVLNITFKDETTLARINATIDSSIFNYYFDDASKYNTYTFSNLTLNTEYDFCIFPNFGTLISNTEIKYSSTNGGTYPQLTYLNSALALTNASFDKTLYLLGSTSGQYVTFQVVSPSLQAISGVSVVAQRIVDGVITTVASGTTDNSGTIAMWLNPLYSHTITFSKDGYVTKTETITPSQSAYTIILNAVSTGSNVIDYGQDINYFINPANNYLNTSTNYLFVFGINSTSLTIAQYGFNITNSSGFIIATNFSTGNYGNVTYLLNTGLNDTYIMNAYWIVNSTLTSSNKIWIINNNSDTEFSIANLGKDLNAYANSGMFGLSPFTLAIICFFVIFITCGIISYNFGIYSPTAIAGVAIAMSILFTYLGFLESPIGAVPYFIPLILGLVGIVIAWREFA